MKNFLEELLRLGGRGAGVSAGDVPGGASVPSPAAEALRAAADESVAADGRTVRSGEDGSDRERAAGTSPEAEAADGRGGERGFSMVEALLSAVEESADAPHRASAAHAESGVSGEFGSGADGQRGGGLLGGDRPIFADLMAPDVRSALAGINTRRREAAFRELPIEEAAPDLEAISRFYERDARRY